MSSSSEADVPDADQPPASLDDLVGTRFADRFDLARLVSAGANNVVYDAVDDATGRTVTVKLIRAELSASPSFRERFDETMRSVAALSHPNIAAVFDWGMAPVGDRSIAYVVVERLSAGSVRDMFDRARQLSPSQALAVGLDACRGLDYAHRRGFVHGELTPSKLVFGDDRRLRITDFGLARLLSERTWENPESVDTHTAWYASPEQGQSQPIDGATDVYALCLTLQEAVTGTLPFKHDSTVASLAARVGKLMPVSADLGPLAAVFEHAGRPDPAERSTAAEFGKELVRAASKLPRPEPLPLLSTGLFETPAELLRTPDDPTGGVSRPLAGEARPAERTDAVASGGADDLVILPVDSELGARHDVEPIADATAPLETPAVPGHQPVEATQPLPHVVEAPLAPRRRRGFPWKLTLAVIVLAALAVLGVLASRLFATPSYPVPDLVELPEAEARNLVAANGWDVTVENDRSDVVPVVGQVIRTAPSAGAELAEGEPFLIVVSQGPTLRALPESSGVPLAEAQTLLIERGLDVAVVEAFDEVVAPGVVISWSVPGAPTVAAGAEVEPGTLVELVVSTGPAPRAVPDLTGHTLAEAQAELDSLGLVVAEIGQEFNDVAPLGAILSQSIEPGAEVERGTTIGVVTSIGPDLVAFPDISAAVNYNQAADLLFQAGFTPRLVFGDAEGQVQSYTIDGVQPEIGQTFRRGAQVDIRAL